MYRYTDTQLYPQINVIHVPKLDLELLAKADVFKFFCETQSTPKMT